MEYVAALAAVERRGKSDAASQAGLAFARPSRFCVFAVEHASLAADPDIDNNSLTVASEV
jgi:hypothetical protein